MREDIKKYIENNMDLIELDNWSSFFENAPYGMGAFLYAAKIKFMQSLNYISSESFYGDTMNEKIIIPDNIKKIEPNAFERAKIQSIVIPRNLEFIGRMAFTGCINLTDVYIPISVKKIQEFAFSSCPNLTIHYEGYEIPTTWSIKWNSGHRPVKFGEVQPL